MDTSEIAFYVVQNSEGKFFRPKPPKPFKRMAIAIVINAVVIRMHTMVRIGAVSDPIAMKLNAVPKPTAAPKANNKGLIERPLENSGPLVRNAPSNASAQPIALPVVNVSPPINAIDMGITAESELIGETTPMRPVANPA